MFLMSGMTLGVFSARLDEAEMTIHTRRECDRRERWNWDSSVFGLGWMA